MLQGNIVNQTRKKNVLTTTKKILECIEQESMEGLVNLDKYNEMDVDSKADMCVIVNKAIVKNNYVIYNF